PQASVVQGFRSSQSVAVAQGMHPTWATCSQTPFALQGSVVQGLRSSQSAAVVHGTQSAMVAYAQAPASQESVVQALPSSQSAVVVHALTVAACATSTASRLSIAARAHAPRADLVLLICPLPSLCVQETCRGGAPRVSARKRRGEHAGPRMHRGPLSGQNVSGCHDDGRRC